MQGEEGGNAAKGVNVVACGEGGVRIRNLFNVGDCIGDRPRWQR